MAHQFFNAAKGRKGAHHCINLVFGKHPEFGEFTLYLIIDRTGCLVSLMTTYNYLQYLMSELINQLSFYCQYIFNAM